MCELPSPLMCRQCSNSPPVCAAPLRDGDGFISAAELRDAMAEMGQVLNSAESQALLREADTDGEGEASMPSPALPCPPIPCMPFPAGLHQPRLKPHRPPCLPPPNN